MGKTEVCRAHDSGPGRRARLRAVLVRHNAKIKRGDYWHHFWIGGVFRRRTRLVASDPSEVARWPGDPRCVKEAGVLPRMAIRMANQDQLHYLHYLERLIDLSREA